ncbi:MAG TPA: hypothetical protein VKR32_17115 [Puia sp.]|nr:hypothetical protein [Puia sp.]
MEALDLFFKSINDSITKLVPMKSLQISPRLLTSKGIVSFLYEGDEITVKDGRLVDDRDPSHVITSIRGTIASTRFEISVMDLKTRELSIVKL